MENKGRFFVVSVRVVLAVLLTVASFCGAYFGLSWVGTNNYSPASVTIIDQGKKYDAAKLKADLEKTKWAYPAELVVYVGKTPKPESKTIPMSQTPDQVGPLANFFMTYPKYGYLAPRAGVVLFYYDTEKPFCTIRESYELSFKRHSAANSTLMTQCLKDKVTQANIVAALTNYGKGTKTYSDVSKTWLIAGTVGITLLTLPIIVLLVSLVGTGSQAANKNKPNDTVAEASEKEIESEDKERKFREPFSIRTFQVVVSIGMIMPVIIGFAAVGIFRQSQTGVVKSTDVYAHAPAYLKGVSDELGTSDAGKLYQPNVEIVDTHKRFIANPKALKESLSKLGFTKKISLTVIVTAGREQLGEEGYYELLASDLMTKTNPFEPYRGKLTGLHTRPGNVVLLYTTCLKSNLKNCQGVYERFHIFGLDWLQEDPQDNNGYKETERKEREEFKRYTVAVDLMNLSALAQPVDKASSVHLDRVIWETAVGLANTKRGIFNEQPLLNNKTSEAGTVFSYAVGISGVLVLVLFLGFVLVSDSRYRKMVDAGGAVVRGRILDSKPGFGRGGPKETVVLTTTQFIVGFLVFAVGVVTCFLAVRPVESKDKADLDFGIATETEQKVAPLSVTVRDPAGLFDAAAVKKAAENRKYPVPINVLVTSEQSCSSEGIGLFGNEKFFMGPGQIRADWEMARSGQTPNYKTLEKASPDHVKEYGSKYFYNDTDVRPNTLVLCVKEDKVEWYQNANIRPVWKQSDIGDSEIDYSSNSDRVKRTETIVKIFTGSDPFIALTE